MRRRPALVHAVGLLVLAAGPAAAWMRRITGDRVLVDDTVVAMVADSRGDLVAETHSTADPGGCRVRIAKRDADTGRVLWDRWVGACGDSNALAVDANDDVVVALTEFTVEKLDGRTGDVRWRARPDPSLPWYLGAVFGIAIDAAGDVVAVGSGGKSEDDPGDTDFAVEKLSGASGALAWRFSLDGTAAPCDPDVDYCEDVFSTDAANAVAIDENGRVIVAGTVQRGNDTDLTVVALDDATGALVWKRAEPGTATMLAPGLHRDFVGGAWSNGTSVVIGLDPSSGSPVTYQSPPGGGRIAAIAATRTGDVVVAGVSGGAGALRVFAARLGHFHGVAWSRDFPYPVATPDGPDTIALANDADRNLTLLASASSAAGPGSLVARLDAHDGDVVWTAAPPTRLRALAALARGDVAVGGELRTSPTNLDATVVRLSGGAVRWQVQQDGVANGEDDAAGVAIDAAGDIFVAGTVENAYLAGFDSLTVVKLARRSGQEIWRREVDGVSRYFPGSYDAATGITLDSAGDPIAIGVMDNREFDFDAAVVKLDGATGAERWRTFLHTDGVADRDWAYAVLTDANDDVVVLATLNDAAGRVVPTLVSLDGTTGAERWRRALFAAPYSSYGLGGIARAGDGSIVGSAAVWNGATQRFDTLVAAFDADTGRDRWRRLLPDGGGMAVGVDAAGRIVVAARASGEPQGSDVVAIVLDDKGTELRRTLVTAPESRPAFAIDLAFDDAGGFAVVGVGGSGPLEHGFVARVDAGGALVWRRTVTGAPGTYVVWSGKVAMTPGRGVVAGFTTFGPASGWDMLLVGLDGGSGAERWRRVVDGDASDPTGAPVQPYDDEDKDILRDLAVGPQGDVVAVGVTEWSDSGQDMTVVDLQGRSGRDRPAPRWGRCKLPRGKAARPRWSLVCAAAGRVR